MPHAADPPLLLPPTVLLSYDAARLDALVVTHFAREAVLGLDCEWRPTFRPGQPPSPTALVQLSSASVCVLFPVAHLRACPPRLAALLNDGAVWKVGCGVRGDVERLLRDLGVTVRGIFDAAVAGQALGYASPGLKGLCAAFGVALHKTKRVSLSNWEARPLQQRQQDYAAQDAFVSLQVVLWLHGKHGDGVQLLDWIAANA